jgi:hypothetical protein
MNIELSLEVFELLKSCDVFQHRRHEVGCVAFVRLRKAVRSLIVLLRDSDDEWVEDQLFRLQRQLSRWLTTPCGFRGDSADELITCLGEVERLCAEWGEELGVHIDSALTAADILAGSETELQREVRTVMEVLLSQGRDFRILCHRNDHKQFINCLVPSDRELINPSHFLYSLSEYRDCRPFDALLKVGPLRGDGWSATPFAVMNAPRFRELIQITWRSTPDDPSFGADLVLTGVAGENQFEQGMKFFEAYGGVKWDQFVIPCGEDVDRYPEEEAGVDDLTLMAVTDVVGLELRKQATLLVLGDRRGILYPAGACVMIFDPAEVTSVFGERLVAYEVRPGDFIIWPKLDDGAIRGLVASAGQYHELWRSLLAEELSRDAKDIASRLKAAGLNLAHPEVAARNWARTPSSVIHAPQKKRHFEILMKVLGVPQTQGDIKIWANAWREVRQSRGEAIQAGVQEHARLVELYVNVLRASIHRMSDADLQSKEFALEFSGEGGLHGKIHFLKVEGVEDGYRVPEEELRQLLDIDEALKWRA